MKAPNKHDRTSAAWVAGKRCAVLGGLVWALVGQSHAATVDFLTYSDRAEWAAVVGGHSVEDFSDGAAGLFDVAFCESGKNPCNALHTGQQGIVVNGADSYLQDRVRRSSPRGASYFTELRFLTPIFAFGANFDLSVNAGGQGLKLFADGVEVVTLPTMFTPGGFTGFLSDSSFTTLTIEASNGRGWGETYRMDNVSSVSSALSVSAVPEPGALALWAMGGLVLGARGRRRAGRTSLAN